MTAKFQQQLQQAIDNGVVAGAGLVAFDKNGDYIVNKSFGKSDVGENAPDFTQDTLYWLASSTKLVTSIAALQLVEKGELSLDGPIADVLPELAARPIITGFDENNEPILEPLKRPITLTHLLTHSSGISYDMMHPTLTKYREHLGMGLVDRLADISSQQTSVSLFQPGESWMYGFGIDWAGLAVERVSGLKLNEYIRKYVFDVLGVSARSTFIPWEDEKLIKQLHGRITREGGPDNTNGKVIRLEDDTSYPNTRTGFHSGGGGLYSSVNDYSKILRSILLNDGQLLKPQTVNKYMKQGQLEPGAKKAFNQLLRLPDFGPGFAVGQSWDDHEQDLEWDHGLASALIVKPMRGVAGPGTMYWGGVANNNWWIDSATGVAGYYGTWIVPFRDVPTMQLYADFRKAVFEEVQTKS